MGAIRGHQLWYELGDLGSLDALATDAQLSHSQPTLAVCIGLELDLLLWQQRLNFMCLVAILVQIDFVSSFILKMVQLRKRSIPCDPSSLILLVNQPIDKVFDLPFLCNDIQ